MTLLCAAMQLLAQHGLDLSFGVHWNPIRM